MQPLAGDEPAVVGPYRLLGRLGSGGMGRVYLGRSAGGRTVAVKIVHPHFALDEEFRARFRREVAAARRVGGAWTAPVLDADPDAAVPWVATAYAAGPSLAAAVTDGGPLPAHTVRALGAGLAEALAAVHELGLVHRDVKPSNVLLTLDGPLLIDFGIARAIDGTASLTSSGVSIGSPGYMSPEQILGKGVTGAADMFSLGAVLAYAANGEPPFPGDSSAALLYKVVHEEPELGTLSGELRSVAEACLAKEAGARPGPAEVAAQLAPQGAARLVTGGWLPGALVERVSRSAVQALNLEAAQGVEPAQGAVPASGPVGFSSPSVGASGVGALGVGPSGVGAAEADAVEAGAVAGAAVAGEFGPPPTVPPAVPEAAPAMPAGSPAMPSASPATPVALPAMPSAPPAMPSASPATPSASPTVAEPRDAVPPGKVSVSVAATAVPGEGGRGRRVSCTVALAVAGALAAVTVGLGFLVRPWIVGGDDGSGGSANAGTGPSVSPSAAFSPASGAIPAAYLGTWEGTATALSGNLPIGTFRITVEQAAVGAELGRLRQTDQLGGVCTDVLTLKSVTATKIVASSEGVEGNHDGCDPDRNTVYLTPSHGDLVYTSDSSAEGNPVAVMSKTGD
ncbi:serine/threonine protein kinase [Streptomyces sp. Ag109_O5-1]|uniref:serine/threonine-protein kinase n=1 Tax=Streptomyces sp. Ag109_O5-1 TaxID=1938851 RepID=UPI000F50EFE8|nr:serine/threonine-protein kinase [Streptomyces sp. Ag109_O5-1]RPE41675.1 serine/threonine protein kinase [Streptomyces sp. Ag109_O5-1]